VYALHDERQLFMTVANACHAFICCRTDPGQKAAVVRIVQKNSGCITISVGDGANDVAMIQVLFFNAYLGLVWGGNYFLPHLAFPLRF